MFVAMVDCLPGFPAPDRVVAAYLAVLARARLAGFVVTRLKMAKLLYLADLAAVRRGDQPVSGLEWRWLDHGPFDTTLQFLENELVDREVVRREPYYSGFRLRLAEAADGQVPASGDFETLAQVLDDYGGRTATSLRDLSYQTAPMLDARRRGRGVLLDLSLERPALGLGRLARRMGPVLRRLPEQQTDIGVFDDIVREMDDLGPARGRAVRALLDDE